MTAGYMEVLRNETCTCTVIFPASASTKASTYIYSVHVLAYTGALAREITVYMYTVYVVLNRAVEVARM